MTIAGGLPVEIALRRFPLGQNGRHERQKQRQEAKRSHRSLLIIVLTNPNFQSPALINSASVHFRVVSPAAIAGVAMTEVVIGEVERQRRLMVLPLLRESIRQPGEPSNRHADIKILTLYMRRADAVGIGSSVNDSLLDCQHFWWRIPTLRFLRLAVACACPVSSDNQLRHCWPFAAIS